MSHAEVVADDEVARLPHVLVLHALAQRPPECAATVAEKTRVQQEQASIMAPHRED